MEKISDKIRILRTKFGMTQQDLASALGIERSTYTYYELGKTTPSWNTIKKMAKIFRITPYDLLEEQNKYLMSDVNLPIRNMNICDLNENEKKLIISLRLLSDESSKEAFKSINKILNSLKGCD